MKKFFVVLAILISFFFLTCHNSASSSLVITGNYGNCGYSLDSCAPEAVAGAVRVPPLLAGGTCNEVYGANSEFPKKKALLGSGKMSLCSLSQDSLFIISKKDGQPNPPYCYNKTNKPQQPNSGKCPLNYQPSGSFRVGKDITDANPRGWDYCGYNIVNGNLTLCTKENATMLIWSDDCGETNYVEACYGDNKGAIHVGPGASACNGSTYYGISASGKKIKSGWMYLCLNQSYRQKPPVVSPNPPMLQTTYKDPTPGDGKAFNASTQDWYAINTSSYHSSDFPDYFGFKDVLYRKNCNSIFYGYINETAWSGVMQGFLIGNNSGAYTNNSFNCSLGVSRADASVFLARALNLTVNTTGGPHFTDVQPTHPAYAAVETLYNLGVSAGCGGGAFCENTPIKRWQMAVWIAKALVLPDVKLPVPQTYCDVSATHSAYSAIENITARVIAIGDYGENCEVTKDCPANQKQHCFLPDANLTREQLTKMLVGASRKCFAEVNGTNNSMELGVDSYCFRNFTGITLPSGADFVEYDYKVWAGGILGNWYESASRKVFFYAPSCSLTANPSVLPSEGGTSTIRIAYRNLENPGTTSESTPRVNCGNGNTVNSRVEKDEQRNGLHYGNYTANCSYAASEAVTYTATASINGIPNCMPAQVNVSTQLPQVNFLDARCPTELIAENSAVVSVELVQNGKRKCDPRITLAIKVTDPNGIPSEAEYDYLNCDANKLNTFSVKTETDGLYEVTAGITEFETSKCSFRVFHKRAANIPELNPLALLAVFALAFAFLRSRRRAREN